jgi:acyl-CoA reductase-like NAD-dependent aldehyde dehydrogenase
MQRWADLMEEEATTLARLEATSSTRPIAQLIEGDIAVTAEQIRFFAEFADKEGSDVALRRDWCDHTMELPDFDGRLEARPGTCRRQRRGHEAV